MVKIGIVISVQKTKFVAVSYMDNLEESIQKVSELGYNGVELAIRDPWLLDIDVVKAIVDKYRLGVPAIGTGQVYLEEGLSFTEDKKQSREKAVERVKRHISFASSFNAGVIIGLIRGRGDGKGSTNDQRETWLDKALEECALFAQEKKVTLLIEPLNRYETSLINTIEEGIELIERLSLKNIKLLIDTFHMNIEEPSIYGSIVKSIPYLGHVHFADSNRHAPSSGHLNFRDVVSVLAELDYERYISMEMLPLPSSDKAAQTAINCLRSILQGVN